MMDDDSGGSMEPVEEVQLMGLGECACTFNISCVHTFNLFRRLKGAMNYPKRNSDLLFLCPRL